VIHQALDLPLKAPDSELSMTTLDVEWYGPLAWLSGDDGGIFSADLGRQHGVYLFTIPFRGEALVYAAGVTRRSFRDRLWEHTKEYFAGTYNVLDASALLDGQRRVLWPGLWYKADAWTRLEALIARGQTHFAEVTQLLHTFQIFLAPLPKDQRLLERIEAAIMLALYSAPPPFSEIPDPGMHLSPRRPEEPAIMMHSHSEVPFCGLPPELLV